MHFHAQRRNDSRRIGLAWCLLLAIFAVLVWRLRIHSQVSQAKSFCESLLPKLNQSKIETGVYPVRVDPSWWEGRRVPSLIRTQNFYLAWDANTKFELRLEVPWTLENIWAFDSRFMRWINYDSNPGSLSSGKMEVRPWY